MEGRRREVVVSSLQFKCFVDVSINVAAAERNFLKDITSVKRKERTFSSEPSLTRTILPLMQKLAKELGVVIPVSFFEEANNAHYNSIAIIDADGTDLGIYRKSHIPDGPGYQEKFYFNPGDTGFEWFPEATRAMVLQGAEVHFYPTAIGSQPQDQGLDSRDHWKRVMQGHAEANVVPLVASNRICSVSVYNILMDALYKTGKIQESLLLLSEMKEYGVESDYNACLDDSYR